MSSFYGHNLVHGSAMSNLRSCKGNAPSKLLSRISCCFPTIICDTNREFDGSYLTQNHPSFQSRLSPLSRLLCPHPWPQGPLNGPSVAVYIYLRPLLPLSVSRPTYDLLTPLGFSLDIRYPKVSMSKTEFTLPHLSLIPCS